MTKPKPKSKKKKKVSYEMRVKRLKEYRANLSDEKKQKIREYNRVRSMMARANESPLDRERRLQKNREQALRRRVKRKAAVDREMRRMGLLPNKANPTNSSPLVRLNNLAIAAVNNNINQPQTKFPQAVNKPASAYVNAVNNVKKEAVQQVPIKSSSERVLPAELPLPFINYKPSFPAHMSMPPTNMNDDYDDMATVCPIECNVDIGPEPFQKNKQTSNSVPSSSSSGETFIKNIGAHVVLKKKVVNRSPPEEVKTQNGGGVITPRGDWNGAPVGTSDWNGIASVCPIECNVDISDTSEPVVLVSTKSNPSDSKRNTLLDSLKQMGTHVTIKKKPDSNDIKNSSSSRSNTNVELSRILPIECNVDIKPVESKVKSSELTIVKHNGNSNITKLGSHILMKKVSKPIVIQEKKYDSPDEEFEDYDMPVPIECNVDISESS